MPKSAGNSRAVNWLALAAATFSCAAIAAYTVFQSPHLRAGAGTAFMPHARG